MNGETQPQRGRPVPTRGVSEFVINLDLPQEQRWIELLTIYKPQLLSLIESMDRYLCDSVLLSAGQLLLKLLTKSDLVMYSGEIESIGKFLDVDVGKIAALQLAYEMFSACTSLAFDAEEPVLWRSMDWQMPELNDLTVHLHFQSNGKFVFRCASWVGYVGVLTGMNRIAAISVNYRRSGGTMFDNLWAAINSHWPVGFLVRHILSSPTAADGERYSYELVQHHLRTAKLISPTYFTLCGTARNQVCVITRDRTRDLNLLTTEGDTDCGWLVQTNMDHWLTVEEAPWQDIEWSNRRQRFAHQWLSENLSSFDRVEELMQTEPIKAFDTIYYTKMCCGSGEMVTRVFC